MPSTKSRASRITLRQNEGAWEGGETGWSWAGRGGEGGWRGEGDLGHGLASPCPCLAPSTQATRQRDLWDLEYFDIRFIVKFRTMP